MVVWLECSAITHYGWLQALECLKILTGAGEVCSGSLLLLDGLDCRVRHMKLRPRRPESTVTQLVDYTQFCGAAATDKESEQEILATRERVTVRQLAESSSHLLVDVRPEPETEICSLPGSLHLPLSSLQGEADRAAAQDRLATAVQQAGAESVLVICRRGNDSQEAAKLLQPLLPNTPIRDVIGGLTSWAKLIDHDFPIY